MSDAINNPDDELRNLKYKHGDTMRRYLFAKDIVDHPRQAITADVMVAIADYVALQLAPEKNDG